MHISRGVLCRGVQGSLVIVAESDTVSEDALEGGDAAKVLEF